MILDGPQGWEIVTRPTDGLDPFQTDNEFLGYRKEGTSDPPIGYRAAWRQWEKENGQRIG